MSLVSHDAGELLLEVFVRGKIPTLGVARIVRELARLSSITTNWLMNAGHIVGVAVGGE